MYVVPAPAGDDPSAVALAGHFPAAALRTLLSRGQVRSAYQDGLYAGKGWVTMLAPTAVTYGQEAG